MGEMKPTPGPWEATFEQYRWVIDCPGEFGPKRALAVTAGFYPKHEANARLIVEAGTVFHNTGLSPVQLVEMVKELKAALCLMVRTHDEPAENLLQEVKEQQWLDKARAALAKCEGVK